MMVGTEDGIDEAENDRLNKIILEKDERISSLKKDWDAAIKEILNLSGKVDGLTEALRILTDSMKE